MTAYEMMLSESQERMLMVLKPGREDFAEAIFRKWELDFAVIGHVTETGHMVLKHKGETVCDIPLAPLADDAPSYNRPYVTTPPPAPLNAVPDSSDLAADLTALMASPALASRSWIWQQYDHMVMADTVQIPGGDAGVIRIHGTNRGLAVTTDCTPRYCFADPFEGGKQAIAECYRNLVSTGARPLATTDCMNFGNPERPEIMGQFVGCIEGMGKACKALDMPIVSGNVSLYNETTGPDGVTRAILPTPAIGAIGLIEDLGRMMTLAFKAAGETIVVIGGNGTCELGQSLWLDVLHGRREGAPPQVDLKGELESGGVIASLIAGGKVSAVHDISDGGLAVAVAEMALASGIGAELSAEGDAGFWFGEGQARYVVTTSDSPAVIAAAEAGGVRAQVIGTTGGDAVAFASGASVTVTELRERNLAFFREWMEG